MTGVAILELTQERLGDINSRVYYTDAIVLRHVNYAISLISMLQPYRLYARTSTTISALGCFLDMRVVAPRYLSIRRIVLGNVATQQETLAYGQTRRLHRISLDALAARRQWIASLGVPRLYCLHGKTLLAVYPRPTADTTITIMTRTMPTPYTIGTLVQECELQPAIHSIIPDVVTGLALLREGTTEGQKGVQMLAQVLPGPLIQGLGKAIGGLKQEAVDRAQTTQKTG